MQKYNDQGTRLVTVWGAGQGAGGRRGICDGDIIIQPQC